MRKFDEQQSAASPVTGTATRLGTGGLVSE